MNPEHIFFDLDNTLTPSKSPIRERDIPALRALAGTKDVIVVSGHGEKDIRKYLGPQLAHVYHMLGANGNYAETKDGQVLWNNLLTPEQKRAILAFCQNIHDELAFKVRDENDLIEDRDSQITYSLIGHHEDFRKKTEFDPGAVLRNKILAEHPDEVRILHDTGVDVVPGGTTGLDFFLAGHNKGVNVAHFIDRQKWNTEDCLYVGDALFPGGNDACVIGVIPTHAVGGPDETFEYIQECLLR